MPHDPDDGDEYSYRPRQWKHDCRCLPQLAEQRRVARWRRMHSEITTYNVEYFAAGKTPEDVSEDDLREILENHDHVLMCNSCGAIRAIDDESDGLDNVSGYDWGDH